MSLRIAFIGFRHGHVFGLYRLVEERDDIEIVGACEEHAETREGLAEAGVDVTHDSYSRMLDEVECDVLACGDYYGIRGERLIQAMETGRHVIADKPLCTSLSELTRIKELAGAKGLKVGCMLDLRALGPYITLRDVLKRGQLGEVHTITFLGQHPLNYGQRPMWYFEEGKHGGTINDIAIHGIDIIPWLTGRRIVEVTAARVWNAKAKHHPHFQDGAILMLRLDNNGAVMGDVSYLGSDRHGYQMAPYWRFTISGSEGVAETACQESKVILWRHNSEEVIEAPAAENRSGAYLDDFLADLEGAPNEEGLHTEGVLESARIALLTQQAAESGEFPSEV